MTRACAGLAPFSLAADRYIGPSVVGVHDLAHRDRQAIAGIRHRRQYFALPGVGERVQAGKRPGVVEVGIHVGVEYYFDGLLPGLCIRLASGDKKSEPCEEEDDHGEIENRRLLGRAFELAPDEDAPKSRDESRPLPERVGDCRACRSSSDERKERARRPYRTAQYADKMDWDAAFEPVGSLDGIARDRLFHHDRVEHEVRRQHAEREDEERRIGRHAPGRRRGICEVHVDDAVDERREPAHEKAGADGKPETLLD